MVAEEIACRLAAAEAEGVIKEAGVQVFIVQPGGQGTAVLAQVGDGSGFIGKQIAQRQGVLLQVSDDVAHAARQAGARQLPVAPVFSRGQVTELVGIENTAGVTVRQGLALRPLFELPGGEREMHQHGDVMRTVVAAALKADFADGVFIGQVFLQHLPFLQEAEAVQPRGNLRAGVEEGFAGGMVVVGWEECVVEALGSVLDLRATRKFFVATLFGADSHLIAKHLVLQPIECARG